MTLNFLVIRICDGNVIFLRHKVNQEIQIKSFLRYLYLSTSLIQ